jgi:hypothetical protein
VIAVSIQSNIDQVVSELGAQIKAQVAYAARKAVVKTAEDVRQAQINEMKAVFDRPTPYTLRGVYNKLIRTDPPTARVWLKDDRGKGGGAAADYLMPQIAGGARPQKRMEYNLAMNGHLPSGWVTVPGQGARLDAYGNMSVGQVKQILSALGSAEMTSGYSANRTVRSAKRRKNLPKFFVIQPGRGSHLHPGVYQRFGFALGSAIKPVLMFVPAATYSPRFNFDRVANATIARVASAHFRAALVEAKARGIK